MPSRSPPTAPDRDDLISVAVVRAQKACFQDWLRVSGLIVPRSEVEVRLGGEGMRVLRALAGPLEDVRAGQVIAPLVREWRPGPALDSGVKPGRGMDRAGERGRPTPGF